MRKPRDNKLGAVADFVVRFLSGEWIIERTPNAANGGTVVTLRSLWLTAWIYVPTFLFYSRFALGKGASFDARQGAADLADTLPWLATIFGAVYVAFYSRFSSQWTYLANLFNQIVQSQLTMPLDDLVRRQDTMASWKAAFIEDAEDLHLAAKPMFLVAVLQWGSEQQVSEKFASNTVGGAERLEDLLENLEGIRAKAEKCFSTASSAATDSQRLTRHG